MSLLVFNSVNLFTVDINEKLWTRAKEVCRALEYNKKTSKTANVVRTHCSAKNFAHKYQLSSVSSTPLNWPCDSRKDEYYINDDGIWEIVLKSKQPKAAEIAKQLYIKVHKHKYTSKENDALEYILKAFDGEKMIRQFRISTYRIDLYFEDYKLAIECDELDHADRDISYEVARQKHIEKLLDCTFIRFNPDAEGFCVLKVVNEIFREIKSIL